MITLEHLKTQRIGVLDGGLSSERDVSLRSGGAVFKALKVAGYDVVEIDVGKDLPARLVAEKVQIAFIGLHGRYGEDGSIQGLLECMFIPYTGSGVLASSVGMEKVFTKQVFLSNGIPTPAHAAFATAQAALDAKLPFPFPVVVKPSREGSSVGVHIAKTVEQYREAVVDAAKYPGLILVEQFIKGREVQGAVLDGQALGVIEIVPAREFYDYLAKYGANSGTQYIFPARLPPDVYERVNQVCLSGAQCPVVQRGDTLRRHRHRSGRRLPARSQHSSRHDRHEPVAEDCRRPGHHFHPALRAPAHGSRAEVLTRNLPRDPAGLTIGTSRHNHVAQNQEKPTTRRCEELRWCARTPFAFWLAAAARSSALASEASEPGRWAQGSERFGLEHVNVRGAEHASDAELLKLTGLQLGQNMLQLDVPALEHAFNSHPWVRTAVVRRRFPSTLGHAVTGAPRGRRRVTRRALPRRHRGPALQASSAARRSRSAAHHRPRSRRVRGRPRVQRDPHSCGADAARIVERPGAVGSSHVGLWSQCRHQRRAGNSTGRRAVRAEARAARSLEQRALSAQAVGGPDSPRQPHATRLGHGSTFNPYEQNEMSEE